MRGKGSRWRRSGVFAARARRHRRAVSDVVATILLLALTVTLFAAIFAFVTTWPAPAAQSNNQFQASLFFPSNGTVKYLAGVHIVHLAGPAVTGAALVYLKSATQPTLSVFANPYSVSSGIGGAGLWNLGQTWTLNFPAGTLPLANGNITIYIVSQSQLLFSVILPGTGIFVPPTIVSTSVSPAVPVVQGSFTILATLSGSYKTNSVYVNIASIPGAPTTAQKMTVNAQGQWTYTVGAGLTNTAGTYYGFVNATGSNGTGYTAVGQVTVTISATGGTVNGPFAVGVILIPSPPNGNTTETVQAVVTYSGVLSPAAALNVTFTAITNPYTAANKWVGWAPSGLTILGGTSVTVASKTTWLVPSPYTHPAVASGSSFTIYANATVTGIGTVPGLLTFTPPYLSLSSSNALIGTTLTVTGSSFGAKTPVQISIGGQLQTLSACTSGTISTSDLNVTTTSSGGFVCTLALAAGTPATAANALATNLATGQNATASFTPTDWTLSVTPTSGRVGILVNVTGVGFVATSNVALTMGGLSVTVSSCSSGTAGSSAVTSAAGGGFVCKIGVPYGISSGAVSIVASDATGAQTATASFTVTAWSLTVSPTSVLHTTGSTTITLTGAGFSPVSLTGTTGSNVTISLNGTLLASGSLSYTCTSGTLTGSTITTTLGGAFTCTIKIAKSAAAGIWTFLATDFQSGQTSTALLMRT